MNYNYKFNILIYYRLFKNYFYTKLGSYYPRSAEVAINYNCNLSCNHCSRSNLTDDEIPGTILKKFFSEFDRLNGSFVTFTGGEPLLRKDLIDLLHFIRTTTSLKVTITTNATLLTPEMLSKLHNEKLQGLNISVYGAEEEHDAFVNKRGAFKETIQNAIRAKSVIPSMCFMTVPTKTTIRNGSLDYVIKLGAKHGVPVRINMPTFSGKFACEENLIDGKDREYVYSLYKKKIIGTDSVGSYTHNRCPSTHSAFYISPSGEFTPCPFIQFAFGNINKSSLKLIYDELIKSSYHKLKFKKFICPPAEDANFIESVLKPLNNFSSLPVDHTNIPQLKHFIKDATRDKT